MPGAVENIGVASDEITPAAGPRSEDALVLEGDEASAGQHLS